MGWGGHCIALRHLSCQTSAWGFPAKLCPSWCRNMSHHSFIRGTFFCISLSFAFSETRRRSGRNLQPTGRDLRLPAYCHGHCATARLHQHHRCGAEFWADWRYVWVLGCLAENPKCGCCSGIIGGLLRGLDRKREQSKTRLACQLLPVKACTWPVVEGLCIHSGLF